MGKLLDPGGLLEHWEGHRRLTRRTIEAFPQAELFNYVPAPPLRSFAEMIREALELDPVMRGIATGQWEWSTRYEDLSSKDELLSAWDESATLLRNYWREVTSEKLNKVEPDPFFGGPPSSNLARVLYLIDNEIHHRAQGYVYLRMLGRTPPPFHER